MLLTRSWRNWQTRKTKDLVGNSMQVQFLSTAPKIAESLVGYRYFFVLSTGRENRIIICRFTREIRQTKTNYLTQAVPCFDALPFGQIPVELSSIPGRSFSLSFAQIAS